MGNGACDDDKGESLAFKTRSFVVSSWNAASKYTRENQLIERGVEGTGKGIEYVGDKVTRLLNKNRVAADKEEEAAAVPSNDERNEKGDESKNDNSEHAKLVEARVN